MKEILNLTPDRGTLSVDTTGLPTFDMGNLTQHVPASFKLLVKDAKHGRTKYGCMSCTTGSTKQMGSDIEMTITYDAKTHGVFNKAITEVFEDGTQQIIKFKGKVV